MDPALRQAWTGIVTADDYEQHMAAIGQAQAAAELTIEILRRAPPAPASVVAIAGAGTGQMLDFLDPNLFRPYRLICTDLNASFLDRLRERLARHGLEAEILQDDFENSGMYPEMDLLLATLLLEHIDWHRGVTTIGRLRPRQAGIILQENPAGMTSAITPGRAIPPSLARAAETAHPTLVPRDALIDSMETHGYSRREVMMRAVADEKRLVALQFDRIES